MGSPIRPRPPGMRSLKWGPPASPPPEAPGPGRVKPSKNLFNLWEQTETQTELHWSKPDNAADFQSLTYLIQLKAGKDARWEDLTEVRQPLFRVYFVDGKVLLGKTRITQSASTELLRLWRLSFAARCLLQLLSP